MLELGMCVQCGLGSCVFKASRLFENFGLLVECVVRSN